MSQPRLARATDAHRILTVVLAMALAAALAFLLAPRAAADSGGGLGTGTPGADDPAQSLNLTPGKYKRIWTRTTVRDRKWARKVSYCESGNDPDAVALNGRYRGAFMFTRNAWKTSPRTPGGDPIDYSWKTQAVVAVALKQRDGTQPWPVCG
jgi:hypothetical protein